MSQNFTLNTTSVPQTSSSIDRSRVRSSTSSEFKRALNIDEILAKLLNARTLPIGTHIDLDKGAIAAIIETARTIIIDQPMLLETRGPINVCGDIHGQFYDLLRLLDLGGVPPDTSYLFLGDYVDRADHGIETLCLLLCYKIKFPENFFLLRGNHECKTINRLYGFFDECKRRYSVRLWKRFTSLFESLPVAALVEDRIFCMHGGLSREIVDLQDINSLPRPTEVPEEGILCDLLWADPDDAIVGYQPSDRGVSFLFGADVTKNFLEKNNLDLICRAHQVVEDGYLLQSDRNLVTLFSAPNYCGEFDNGAAIMHVSQDLTVSFQILSSKEKPVRKESVVDK